ncbi:S8 family peptidase [Flavilitoribacter nigricans]|nr:S8 family serine peptidase [Flavilitoribacter nigricans]
MTRSYLSTGKWLWLLLVLTAFFPTVVHSQSPRLQSLTDLPKWKVMGKGKKISHGLERLHRNFTDFRSGGRRGSDFRPTNALVMQDGEWVRIEAVARTDGEQLLRLLEKFGLEEGVAFQRVVNGRLPYTALTNQKAIEQIPELVSLGLAHRPFRKAGSVTSQGDYAQNSDWMRDFFNLDGTGVRVGILSDSYNFLGTASNGVLSGDLPGPGNPNGFNQAVNVLADSGTSDEGRAMAEIVHDIAPGAGLAFHTAFFGRADFADGIVELATVGNCDVIVDDVSYFASPFFQDGLIAQAADQVFASGVSYFSSAGNNAANSYQAVPAPGDEFDITFTDPATQVTYEYAVNGHDFGGGDYFQSVTVPAGGDFIISFQWADPFTSVSGLPGPQTDLDIFLVSSDGTTILEAGIEDNSNGGDAVEIISYSNNTGVNQQLNLFFGLAGGPTPAFLKYIVFGDLIINEYQTFSSTCYGQPNAAGAVAVGAAFFGNTPNFGVSPPVLESFSSRGGTPLFFNPNGSPIASPYYRVKPEIVCPDGADNTFFGNDPDGNGFFNFFGTSAAAPHAAGMAALLKEIQPNISASEVELYLVQAAIDMLTAGFDLDSGFGFVDGLVAVAIAAQCAPDLELSAISSLFPFNDFTAQQRLHSNMVVNSDFSLRAGQEIKLLPGFQVLPGVNFSAAIDAFGCTPPEALVRTDPREERPFARPVALPAIHNKTMPSDYGALRSAPNPFHRQTVIRFELPADETVSLRLVDVTGKVVREILAATAMSRGAHQVELRGEELPAGFYNLILDRAQGRESCPLVKL